MIILSDFLSQQNRSVFQFLFPLSEVQDFFFLIPIDGTMLTSNYTAFLSVSTIFKFIK